MQSVWWKCSLGHSWKAKISERAIEGKGCKVCEKDYLTVFPKLAVMYYAAKKHIKVQMDTDKIIGIPPVSYTHLTNFLISGSSYFRAPQRE